MLARSLDELPPKTRELFTNIVALTAAKQNDDDDDSDVWFTLKDVCESTRLSDIIVSKHLARLLKAELIEAGARIGHTQRAWYRVVTAPNAFASAEPPAPSSPLPAPFQPGGAGGFSLPKGAKDQEKLKTASPKSQRAEGTSLEPTLRKVEEAEAAE